LSRGRKAYLRDDETATSAADLNQKGKRNFEEKQSVNRKENFTFFWGTYAKKNRLEGIGKNGRIEADGNRKCRRDRIPKRMGEPRYSSLTLGKARVKRQLAQTT